MQITVAPQSGDSLHLEVEASDTISKIKTMIHDKNGMKPESQTLSLDGKVLENDHTVKDCGIQDKATVKLEQK